MLYCTGVFYFTIVFYVPFYALAFVFSIKLFTYLLKHYKSSLKGRVTFLNSMWVLKKWAFNCSKHKNCNTSETGQNKVKVTTKSLYKMRKMCYRKDDSAMRPIQGCRSHLKNKF